MDDRIDHVVVGDRGVALARERDLHEREVVQTTIELRQLRLRIAPRGVARVVVTGGELELHGASVSLRLLALGSSLLPHCAGKAGHVDPSRAGSVAAPSRRRSRWSRSCRRRRRGRRGTGRSRSERRHARRSRAAPPSAGRAGGRCLGAVGAAGRPGPPTPRRARARAHPQGRALASAPGPGRPGRT